MSNRSWTIAVALSLLVPACARSAETTPVGAPTATQEIPVAASTATQEILIAPVSAPDASAGPAKPSAIELRLVVGENKEIPADDIASYTVGASGVVDVRESANKIHIVGLRPGSTELLTSLKNRKGVVTYKITILARRMP